MTRWILLLLLPVAIFLGIRSESIKIEQRLHGDVVLALADEDLSEIRVQMDGRKVLLSGPEELLPQAAAVVRGIPGARLPEMSTPDGGSKKPSAIEKSSTEPSSDKHLSVVSSDRKWISDQKRISTFFSSKEQAGSHKTEQVSHPKETYWPVKGLNGDSFSQTVSRPFAEYHTIDGDLIESYLLKKQSDRDAIELDASVKSPLELPSDIQTDFQASERLYSPSSSIVKTEYRVIDGVETDAYPNQDHSQVQKPYFIQILHPVETFWPIKKELAEPTETDQITIDHDIIYGAVFEAYSALKSFRPTIQITHPEQAFWPLPSVGETPVRFDKNPIEHVVINMDSEKVEATQPKAEAMNFVQIIHPNWPQKLSGEELTEMKRLPILMSNSIVDGSIIETYLMKNRPHIFNQVEHPNNVFWPLKNIGATPVLFDQKNTLEQVVINGEVIEAYLSQSQFQPPVYVDHPQETYWPIKNDGATPVSYNQNELESVVIKGEVIEAYLSQPQFQPPVYVDHPQETYWPLKSNGEIPIHIDQNPIEHVVIARDVLAAYQAKPEYEIKSFVEVKHPDDLYWPIREEELGSVEVKSANIPKGATLVITKVKQIVEVSGIVPNNQIKDVVFAKLEQFVGIPDDLFDVVIDQQRNIPDWYNGDMPLLIPFFQWVDEGQLRYISNRILLQGIVQNKRASEAIDVAISNVASRFRVENRLRVEAE